MGIILKIFFVLLLASVAFTISRNHFLNKPKFKVDKFTGGVSTVKSSEEFERLKNRTADIKGFLALRHYNEEMCFLIDMKVASGKKRFFVYNLKKDSILISGLVAHGSCDNNFQIVAKFSNKINSGCSCNGKFKDGKKYTGRFGTAFKLIGLDSSNSKAYERAIVLHSYECVPENETHPFPICNSQGCPMVSVKFLENLKPLIEKSDKAIVLDIFN